MGKVYITGAGPGRADLLTVRAARVLARADAVLYDRLVSAEVLELARPGAEMHDVGKVEGRQEETQARILELLEDCAARHEVVVRLKGGDAMVFGRGGEEWLHLAEKGIEVEVVPGVSSALAAPELAGIPLTLRGVAAGFAVVTGHRMEGRCQEWAGYAGVDTLVILMGVERRGAIAECLMALGRDGATPVAVIERATTADERVVETTLAGLAAAEVNAPAVIVVGEVVRVRRRLGELAHGDACVEIAGFVQ